MREQLPLKQVRSLPACLALIRQAWHIAVDQAEECHGFVHAQQLGGHLISQNPAERPAGQSIRATRLDLTNALDHPRSQALHGAQLLLPKANAWQAVNRKVALQMLP